MRSGPTFSPSPNKRWQVAHCLRNSSRPAFGSPGPARKSLLSRRISASFSSGVADWMLPRFCGRARSSRRPDGQPVRRSSSVTSWALIRPSSTDPTSKPAHSLRLNSRHQRSECQEMLADRLASRQRRLACRRGRPRFDRGATNRNGSARPINRQLADRVKIARVAQRLDQARTSRGRPRWVQRNRQGRGPGVGIAGADRDPQRRDLGGCSWRRWRRRSRSWLVNAPGPVVCLACPVPALRPAGCLAARAPTSAIADRPRRRRRPLHSGTHQPGTHRLVCQRRMPGRGGSEKVAEPFPSVEREVFDGPPEQ